MPVKGDQVSDEFASGRWRDEDPGRRLQAVHSLGKSGPESQHLLADIARDDNDAEVCAAALSYLNDLSLLEPFRNATGPLQEAATLQYNKVLAGSVASDIPEEERLNLIRHADGRNAKQLALLAKSPAAGKEALALLTDQPDIGDVALFAANLQVRKTAAKLLTDRELIKELLLRLGGKDKSVAKLLSTLLGGVDAIDVGAQPNPASDSQSAESTPSIDVAANEPAAADTGIETPATAIEPESVPAEVTAPAITIEEAMARAEQQASAIQKLAADLLTLGHRNTPKLNSMLNEQRNLVQSIQWPREQAPSGAFAELKGLQVRISELLELNRQYQQELVSESPALLAELKQSLEAGQSAEAIQAWDKLQGLLSNLGGKLAKELRKQLNDFRSKINELKDWKNFAGTEKKKELIQHMEHLLESKMNPPDRARQINALHQEWKSLGRTSQNEKLWRQFKKVSDQVYEPCREYFRQQKQQMAENYRQRMEICAQLETYLQQVDREAPNVADLAKIEEQAKSDWRRFAPVEQSRIKKLQKRFYGIMDEIRNLRRGHLTQNSEQKRELVERAKQLTQLEDNRQAMNEAKSLQAQWKAVGPGSFKEDRKLWEAFRAACDSIFQKQEGQKREFLETIGKSVAEARRLLAALSALHGLDDEAFREARKQFSDLQREFREALDSRVKKERKELLDQFNDNVRRIEARYKRLPDRKVLQLRSCLAQRAEYCTALENRLLACADDDTLRALLEQLDGAEWGALPASGNGVYDAAIEARYQTLRQAKSLDDIRQLTRNCTDEARNLCVSLEIRANVSSPNDDQDLRMQIQLSQLKNGFGRGIQNGEDNLKFARDVEMRFLCLGPIDTRVRSSLAARVANAVNRIS